MGYFDWQNFDTVARWATASGEANWRWETNDLISSRFDFSRKVGSGFLEYHQWFDGINILVATFQTKRPLEVVIDDGGGLRFNFALALDWHIALEEPVPEMVIQGIGKGLSWRIINSTENSKMLETWPANTRNSYVTAHLNRSFLTKITGLPISGLPAIFSEGGILGQTVQAYESTAEITEVAAKIHACTMEGALRSHFIRSQIVTLICLAIEQVVEPKNELSLIRLSKADERKIVDIAGFVDSNISQMISMDYVCRKYGINKNKVLAGFKKKFNSNFSTYVENKRLEKALYYTLHTDLPFSEVAEKVGMAHQSSLSTAFKRRFGQSPSKLRSFGRK